MSRVVEEVMYVGPRGALAEKLRERDLAGRMSTAGGWLITVARVVLGMLPDAVKCDGPRAEVSRGILNGLGYDPDVCSLSRKKHPCRGFVVRDGSGEVAQFITLKTLARLSKDELFAGAYAQEMTT